MSGVILERAPIRIPDTVSELLGESAHKDLAERAADALGYQPLKMATSADRQALRLGAVLMQLGIEPFTKESVDAYKHRERAMVRTWKQKALEALSNGLFWAAVVGAAIFMLGVTVGFIVHLNGRTLPHLAPILWSSFLLAIGSFAAGGLIFGVFVPEVWDWSWTMTLIAEYDHPVPKSALEMALAIKQICPDAVISVDSLVLEKRIADPFLVAGLNDERYYVGVWGEPNFSSKFH
jgi:hypothetical protein